MSFLGHTVGLGCPRLSPVVGLHVYATTPSFYMGAGIRTHGRMLLLSAFEHALVGCGRVSFLIRILTSLMLLSLGSLSESEISHHYIFVHSFTVVFSRHTSQTLFSFPLVLCSGQHLSSKVRPRTDYRVLKK